jgi:integrase
MAFTKTIIKSLANKGSGGKRVTHWESDYPSGGVINGFGFRITQINQCSWILNYRVHSADPETGVVVPVRPYQWRQFKLGDFSAISLADARNKAQVILGKIAKGVDPLERTDDDRMTLSEWIHGKGQYAGYYSLKQDARSFKEMERRIKKHIIPALGHKALEAITQKDVLKLRNKVVGKNDARVEANRVLARLSDIFTQARKEGPLKKDFVSPTLDVTRYPEKSRERVLTDEEAKGFMDAVAEEGDHYFEAFIWVMRLTGLRVDEARTLTWKQVDLDATQKTIIDDQIIEIPSPTVTITRMEAKNKTTLVLPLSPEALTVFQQIKKTAGSDHVFPSQNLRYDPDGKKSVPHQPFRIPWNRVRDKTGLRYDVYDEDGKLVSEKLWMHDIRRTLGTTMAVNSSISTIGKVLNQKHASATEIYVRVQQGEMRDAVSKAGRLITNLHGEVSLKTAEKEE